MSKIQIIAAILLMVAQSLAEAAYVRDDQIWPVSSQDTVVEVCWENYDEILGLEGGDRLIAETLFYANQAWGNTLPSNDPGYANGIGSTSLLKFRNTVDNRCPAQGGIYAGIRILARSGEPFSLPGGKTIVPPYVTALGSNLKDLPNGVVLDFDLSDWNVGTKTNQVLGCWFELKDSRSCMKEANIHEFGHIIGLSHEQNRNDDTGYEPTSWWKLIDKFKGCSKDDPYELLNGELMWGNVKIGDYDLTSIMNYCNENRFDYSVLSDIDKAAVLAFYGRAPYLNTDLGYPKITIPVALTGSTKVPKIMELTDSNNDGYYEVFINTYPTTSKSSVPAIYDYNTEQLAYVLDIPFMVKTTNLNGRRQVTAIYNKLTVTKLANGKFYIPQASLTNHFPVVTQP